MSMKKLFTLFWLLTLVVASHAQGPNGTGKYYSTANGLTGEELKTEMYYIIRDPSVVNYSGLKAKYMETDTRADGYLRDWYSDATSYVPGSDFGSSIKKEGDGYNREHLMPQSWYNKVSPMVSDIIQVVPTDGYLNSRRNDNPFGEVVEDESRYNTSKTGYSKWGAPRADLNAPVSTVFEPNDAVKGDIARIYFYMATCYQDRILSWTGNNASTVIGGTTYRPIKEWQMDVLMRWSKLDPVDDVERARNAAAYGVQCNRNPFVDYPGLEDYIWGEKSDMPFSYDYYEDVKQDPGYAGGDDNLDNEPVTEATIGLNNTFFETTWNGSRPTGNNEPIQIIGRKGNITVIYAKGSSGQNMWCNANQIRLYKYNVLTFRARGDEFTEITFTGSKSTETKVLYASTGTLTDFSWTGSASDVEFYTDTENGRIDLSKVYVKLASASTAIEWTPTDFDDEPEAIFGIDGKRHDALQRGMNIVRMKNGQVKKVWIP